MMKSESFPQNMVFFAPFFSPKKNTLCTYHRILFFWLPLCENSPKEKKNTETHLTTTSTIYPSR